MTNDRGPRARCGRVRLVLTAAVLVVAAAGCTTTSTTTPATTTPATTTPASTALVTTTAAASSSVLISTSASVSGTSVAGSVTSSSGDGQPNLTLQLGLENGPEVEAPSDGQLGLVISSILGDVDALTSDQRSNLDVYVGNLDGSYTLSIAVPGATAQQLEAARQALVGSRKFALRPVTGSVLDAKACAALQTTPKSDQLCDPDRDEVLTLGRDLGVVPTRVEKSTDQQSQGATLAFSATDAKTIATWTAAHVGDRLAMTDGLVLVTAPTIQAAITDGRLAVSGGFTSAQAAAMVGRLQLAALGATITAGS